MSHNSESACIQPVSRLHPVRWVIAGLLAALPAGCRSSAPPVLKPNILLVTIDTLRADHLGAYGYAPARTPVLDQLAGEGVRFENAYSPTPLTLPAHSSLFTGSYPSRHGVRDNSGYVLGPDRVTLAEAFKAEGYRTAAFVGAFVLDSKFGLDQGFDFYFDDFDLSRLAEVSPGYVQRPGDEVVSHALEWLEQPSSGAPFFVWVHLYDPHDPYQPPEPYRSRHPGRPYDGEIEFADAGVGRLLEWLRGRNLYQDSLIVVAGDHGESLGEHGEEGHGLFIYDASLRVPLIFRLPRGASAGQVVSHPVSLVDLFPTLVQVAGIPGRSPSDGQGRGLSDLWLGEAVEPVDLYAESFYSLQHFGWSPLRGVIGGRYKYIQAPRPELYDLDVDPGEIRNLAPDKVNLAAEMEERLQSLIARFDNPDSAAAAQPDPQTLARLQALGYVALSPAAPAVSDFSTLLDPKDQIQLYNQIVSLLEMSQSGKHRETIAGYRTILQQQPQLKIVRYKLGQAYFHLGQLENAVAEFKRVIELGGEDALAIFDLAQCYLRLNRVEEAALGFEKTIELDPSHYRARTNLGILYKNQRRIPEAIEQLEKAIEIAPNSVSALNTLGASYSLAGNHRGAVEVLERAVRLAPSTAVLYANLSLAYRGLGNEEQARGALEKARQLDPSLFRPRR